MSAPFNYFKKSVFTGHSGSVYALERGSENSFYTGGGDKVVAEWNLNRPDEGAMIAQVPAVIYSILKLENLLLVGQAIGGIHVIDLNTKKENRMLQYHESGVFSMHHNIYHQLIFTLAGDGMMGVLDAESLSLQMKLSLGTDKLRTAAVSPDGEMLAVGSGDGSIYTFSLPEMKPVRHWLAHQQGFSVNALQFSPDGSQLLSGSRDAHLNVFDVRNDFKLLKSIPAHNYAIYSIEYSPDKNVFATGSRDKTIKIWDAEKFEVLQRIDKEQSGGHVNSVNKIIWLSSGQLISVSDDRAVVAWERSGVEV